MSSSSCHAAERGDEMRNRVLLPAVVAALLTACGTGGSPSSTSLDGTASVFAAASLTDSFKALGASFQSAHAGTTVQFNFAGSPTLVTQIEQGASADVFASADTTNMDKLKADGLPEGLRRFSRTTSWSWLSLQGIPNASLACPTLRNPASSTSQRRRQCRLVSTRSRF